MLERVVLILFFLIGSLGLMGQRVTRQSGETNEPVTALAVRSAYDLGASVVAQIGQQSVVIPSDPDAEAFSYFYSLPQPTTSAGIRMELPPDVQVYYLHSGAVPAVSPSGGRIGQEDCSFTFAAVPQSEWRAGLAAPSYNRSFTEVEHVVVHHSAGSNTTTNYTQVVRDIYLYHTQVNGWSDIGYNYLVAQDGSIFTGRDPAGGAQDDVLGAHFCGANSGTMGICLLGNFETATATSAALASLEQVVAFKVDKEDLNPMGNYPHSLGTLPAIIGHRDGCSTLCPGENVYGLLPALRQSTENLLADCEVPALLSLTVSEEAPQAGQTVTFVNRSTGYDSYAWYFEGGTPETADWELTGEVTYSLPGRFDVRLVGQRENTTDTLYLTRIIQVKAPVPVVYPNPAAVSQPIRIASEYPVEAVQVLDPAGRCVSVDWSANQMLRIPYSTQGIYLVRVITAFDQSTHKLVVR